MKIALSGTEELLIEAYRWIGAVSQAAWPGWRATETPLAVYQPNKRVLLVDHPDPPQGFSSAQSRVGDLAVFDGNHPQISGCTTVDLNGIQTACVLVDYPHPEDCRFASLLGLVVHELFHSHSYSFAAGTGLDELAAYNLEDTVNNALCQVANDLLARCSWGGALVADGGAVGPREGQPSPGALEELLAQYLAVRRYRRSRLTENQRALEDTFERSEGSAQYTAISALVGLREGDFELTKGLIRSGEGQGLLTEDNLASQIRNYVDGFVGFLRRCNVQGFGGPMHRGYMVGAITCSLLDSLVPDWKPHFIQGAVPSELLDRVLDTEAEDIPSILDRYNYAAREETEVQYLAERRRKERELAERFYPVKNPVLIVDYSELPTKGCYSADPMNMVKLPDGRRVHTRIYMLQRPGLNLESHCVPPIPVMENRADRELYIPLPADLKLSSEVDSIDYGKNGLKLECARCSVEQEGESFRVRCYPEPD